jgi:hypothetical protein
MLATKLANRAYKLANADYEVRATGLANAGYKVG